MIVIIIAGGIAFCLIMVMCIGCCLYRQMKANNDKVTKVIDAQETENTVVKKDPTMRKKQNAGAMPVNLINRDDTNADTDMMNQLPPNLTAEQKALMKEYLIKMQMLNNNS